MKRKSNSNLIVIVIIAVVLLAGGLTYFFSSSGSSTGEPPTATVPVVEVGGIELVPPASLADIAAEVAVDYPQLAEMLDNPELDSIYKDFYITYLNGGEEAALTMARQRGLLNENDDVVMLLVLDDPTQTVPLIAELEAEGVTVESSYQEQVNIIIPSALILEQLEAESPDLIIERLSSLEHVIALRLPQKLTFEAGGTVGQGVAATLADQWHAGGITGRGVKVGVLDLGFAGYEGLRGTELPATVTTATFGNPAQFGVQVHGTAVAEIVHEMAPEAELFLAYFDGNPATMAEAVDWLLSQPVDIISNSTSISGISPMDGSGFIAALADKAHAAGVLWVSAAGNRADEHYRSVFSDTDGDTLHDFAPGSSGLPFTMKAGTVTNLILTWNDWAVADQDYDLILYDSSGNLLAKSENFQGGQPGQTPMEVIGYRFDTAGTYLLAVQNREGRARGDARLDLFVYNGDVPTQFRVGEGSLGTPADALGALAVGAVNWSSDALEIYSSQGPTSDGRIKPDLVAPSAVKSVSYAPSIFDGTSAATPHVSGAAALILQANPDFGPDELINQLKSRAIPLGQTLPSNQFGVGRLTLGELGAAAQ